MKRILAVTAAKFAFYLTKLLGRKGTNIGGEIALRICPDILAWFGSQVKDKIVLVTGTNGKTSTNNMIYSIIESSGDTCVSNQLGANLDSGLISAFINHCNWLGYIDADYACLEVDEASLAKVLVHINPDVVVFTNIFKEQSDPRVMDALIEKIKTALGKCEGTELIVNADDPNLVNLGNSLGLTKKYYGIKTPVNMGSEGNIIDSVCKNCGQKLQYSHLFYGQLGHYLCENCGFKRPSPDYTAEVEGQEERKLIVKKQDDDLYIDIDIDFNESYSLYNMLAAAVCGEILGKTSQIIKEGLQNYCPQIGRMERFNLGKPVTLNLAKNPVGFNESMKIIVQDLQPKTVALGINDLPQDGGEVSWLWHTNFELLLDKDHTINQYIVFGRRREDMATRLEDAGIDQRKIKRCDTIWDMIESVEKDDTEVAYVISNYSLLFETQKLLKRRSDHYIVPDV